MIPASRGYKKNLPQKKGVLSEGLKDRTRELRRSFLRSVAQQGNEGMVYLLVFSIGRDKV